MNSGTTDTWQQWCTLEHLYP